MAMPMRLRSVYARFAPGPAGPDRERVELVLVGQPVEIGTRAPHDPLALAFGDVRLIELRQAKLHVDRPTRHRVREIARPHDVVDTDQVPAIDTDRTGDE